MPAGRPTKYKKEFVEQGYKLALCGMIDTQIADFFKINVCNLNVWKQKYPEFQESLKKGKDEFDSSTVEKSLLRRAIGYSYTETTREPSLIAHAKTGKAYLKITKIVKKALAPDVTAQIFWLKNRQPDRWRDRSEMHLGGTVTVIAPSVKKPKSAGT